MTASHIVIDEFTIEMQAECSAIIVAYKGKSEHLTIPSSLDCDGQSIQIAGIKESAFEGNPNLKSVSFAADSKIDAIPPRLLQGCAALMEVHLPSSVSSLGDYCFADCPALRYIIIDGKEGTLAFGNDIAKGSDPFLLIESGLRLEEENRYYWGGYDRLITGYQGIKGITDDGLEYALCHDFDGADHLIVFHYAGDADEVKVPGSLRIDGVVYPTRILSLADLFGAGIRYLAVEGGLPDDPGARYPVFYDNEFDYVGAAVPRAENYVGPHGEINGFAYAICQDEVGKQYVCLLGYKPGLGDNEILKVPSSLLIEGQEIEVKEIADDGFPYFGPCEKVIVPKGIEIGKRAFAGVKDVEILSGD